MSHARGPFGELPHDVGDPDGEAVVQIAGEDKHPLVEAAPEFDQLLALPEEHRQRVVLLGGGLLVVAAAALVVAARKLELEI